MTWLNINDSWKDITERSKYIQQFWMNESVLVYIQMLSRRDSYVKTMPPTPSTYVKP